MERRQKESRGEERKGEETRGEELSKTNGQQGGVLIHTP